MLPPRSVLLSGSFAPARAKTYFEADPHDFIDAGEHIDVTGHFRGRPKGDGGTLDAHFAHVWRMREGKAVHFTNYADTMMWARAMGRT
ncbi:MAG: hypothetical protein M3433_06200 [Actinomycetota bacterium]|nr:hypothetical protein [Actinomycetota bacterium]